MPSPLSTIPGDLPGTPPGFSVDRSGNETVAGSLTVSQGILLAPFTPALPVPPNLVLYSPDGKNLLGLTASGAQVAPPVPGPLPATGGLIAWDYDPVAADNNTTLTLGLVYFHRVTVGTPATANNIVANVNTGGVGLTASQNFAGIYDANGNRLGQTADQSGVWNTTGPKVMPLTAPVSLAVGATYYLAVLTNAATSSPAFQSVFGSSAVNAGIAAAPFRFNQAAAGGSTALPATSTTSTWVAVNNPIWLGLS